MTSKTVIKLTIGLLMIHITAKYLTLNQILINQLKCFGCSSVYSKYINDKLKKDFDHEYQKH